MSAYNFGKMTGILTGVVIGLVVLAVIFVICNKNRKLKTEYDERQQILRGNGYRFGFYAMTVWAGIQILLAAMDIEELNNTVTALEGAAKNLSEMDIDQLNDLVESLNKVAQSLEKAADNIKNLFSFGRD